ncbi:MAG: terpene cyclase/mutase family protein [Deltaproteobacteria bacterium]|nr:terpene cyclase/mutase family protein [Deltaproteobacteria bacterium]
MNRLSQTKLLFQLVTKDFLSSLLPPRETNGTPLHHDKRLDEAIEWLLRSIRATKGNGSSKGFHLLFGWLPPFPETTGYLIPTLIDYINLTGRHDLESTIEELTNWLIQVQLPNGAIYGGEVGRKIARDEHGKKIPYPEVFDTAMVLEGFIASYKLLKKDTYLQAAKKAADFLVNNQEKDGTWGKVSLDFIPHTYHSRCAWILLEFYELVHDEVYRESARKKLDWVLTCQRENGWFERCFFFKKRPYPITHSIAYTLEGLQAGYQHLRDERYLHSVLKTADKVMKIFEISRRLPAQFNPNWKEIKYFIYSFDCLTGIAQFAMIWFRLYLIMGDERYMNAALNAIDYLACFQDINSDIPEIRGAIKGSFPLYGRYAPIQFPNWAAKFFADALMMRKTIISDYENSHPQPLPKS